MTHFLWTEKSGAWQTTEVPSAVVLAHDPAQQSTLGSEEGWLHVATVAGTTRRYWGARRGDTSIAWSDQTLNFSAANPCLAHSGGRYFLFAGLRRVLSTNFGSEAWRDEAPLPVDRINADCLAFAGRMYVVGGKASSDAATFSADVWSSTIRENGMLDGWERVPNGLPENLPGPRVTVLDDLK